jgi:hypothetical protein
LRRKVILGAGLFLEKNGGRKETCKRKSSMQEEKQHARGEACGEKAGKPNHDRVRVFEKGCNDYKLVE